MKEHVTSRGTIRIGKDLRTYEKTKTSWKRSPRKFPELVEIVKLFKAHGRFEVLIDEKNPRFLKGQLSPEGMIQGARITILPNGKKLDKPFSLLAQNLAFHDESSHDHWDVIYQNPNGKYAYLYTKDKIQKAVKNKYQKVLNFEKKYSLLHRKVTSALSDTNDLYALPMYTLLSTYMRVGNKVAYAERGNKGLTMLTKKDIALKGSTVIFTYKGKSGVPMRIAQEFPAVYVKRLRHTLSLLKNKEYVFTTRAGAPLRDTHFMEAFERYCGERFYPHIVRSYYATQQAKRFLQHHKKATKQELKQLFTSIAEKLGHKRFVKKENAWKESYNVTIHYYLEPKMLRRIEALTT